MHSDIQMRKSMIKLHLPYPPSANRLWRRSGNHIHRSTKYTKWLSDAGYIALSQRPGGINGPYRMTIQAVKPDNRRRDLDNLFKATSDLLVSVGVIDDDCECTMISAKWI